MSKSITNIAGKFYRDSYIPNQEITRDMLVNDLHNYSRKNKYPHFVSLEQPYIKHLDRQFTTNFYFKDWQRIIPTLKEYYGEGIFYIVSGFRSPFELGVNVHSTGLAMDILVKDEVDADRLMNAAYMTGIPTIIPAGDIKKGQGHIHLDLAPPPNHVYDAGIYSGPWGDRN